MPILEWLNKGEATKVTKKLPYRMLKANAELSYGEQSENMIIKGDNLEALQALLPYYKGQVKCIYIDPPYNTGNAFEHYDDNLEHSKWLSLMYPRLELLRELLSENGSIWISIDDDECHYLKVICDEVFGRRNYINSISVKMSTASGVKTSHRTKTILKEKEYVLLYAKSKENFTIMPQYIPSLEWDSEFQYILERNNSENPSDWTVSRLSDELNKLGIEKNPENKSFQKYVIKNADKIWRRAFIRGKYKTISQEQPDRIFKDIDEQGKEHIYYKGRELYFFKSKFHNCYTEEGYKNLPSNLLCDMWNDINTGKLFNEGNIDFRNSKKPEFLISRIFELCTNERDLILDSFLGSGTTCAVAQKMGRRYIGIEMGEHAITHCVPRMKAVIDGEQGGISKAVNWQGGGGYTFYDLGETIFDENGNINKNVDFKTLASHVWFTETKTPLSVYEKSPLLGVHNGIAYYLLFNGILRDKKPDGGNVLTQKVYNSLPKFDGKKVIYGEATRMNPEKLKANNIVFKQTPYDVKSR